MVHYAFPRHVGYAQPDGVGILLDLRRDRYLRIGSDTAALFERLNAGEADSQADRERIARLEQAGLLTRAVGEGLLRPPEIIVPSQSVLEEEADRPARASWLAAFAIRQRQRRLSRDLGAEPLQTLIARLGEARPCRDEDPVRSETEARAFVRARRLLPRPVNCLEDALTLGQILAERGLSFSLVFGVKGTPFAAHCWLQTRTHILTDHADRLRAFAPIMKI